MLNFLSSFTKPKVDFLAAPDGQDAAGMVSAKNRYVQIYRPPILLDPNGNTMPGMSIDLVAGFLVSQVTRMVGTNFGAVSVNWLEHVGRFVSTRFTIKSWGQSVDVIHPVMPISGELRVVFSLYLEGIADKVRQMHRGEQNYGDANDKILRALDLLDGLYDKAEQPQFTDPEFAFMGKVMTTGLTMNALLPISETEGDPVLLKRIDLDADLRKAKK